MEHIELTKIIHLSHEPLSGNILPANIEVRNCEIFTQSG